MRFPGHFEPHTDPTVGPSSYNTSLRRPWSPIAYDRDITENQSIRDYHVQDRIPGSLLREARRVQDASDSSVEALDLADYARTLRRPTTDYNNRYPPFPHTSHVHPLSVPTPVLANGLRVAPQPYSLASLPEYPPSPDNDRPFSAQSRDTFNQAPPSLVSGDTSHDTHDSYGGHYPYPSRRPHSLPPFFASMSAERLPNYGSPWSSGVRIASPMHDEETDISRFPAFSRGWYDDPYKSNPKLSSLPPYSSELHYDHSDAFNAFPSTASNQSRNVLPWSSEPSDANGPRIDDAVKEERIRMLEHEFGKKGKAGKEDLGEPVIGSVDEKGVLITVGPKKRAGARWAQGILALATAVSSLYGALFIKSQPPAPPSSSFPAFALYIMSVVTFFFIFYLFALRPCCCGSRRKHEGSAGPNMGGMMVLPVQGLPGGKKTKNKKGKKDKHGGGDVQINLIVDPGLLGGGGRDEEGDYDHLDGSDMSSRGLGGRRGQVPQRRSIFQGLAMESDWKAARSFLKRMLFVDVLCFIVWVTVFVLVLFGKRCPPGGFNGWCNSYNTATATACILSAAFGFSAFFDIVDLHKSRASPRTRT
ncbi:hypothetical protein K439DRAFT_943972 [Ramaria rubella]|nr:hypothetical protein K439DRAFT_943972 [Ramaria rubella]